jgi:cation channel sperm-associated protein 2
LQVHDLFNDALDSKSRNQILLENPNQLIKFKVFKRTQQILDSKKVDRRLTRTKNLNFLPLDAWAGWVIKETQFTNFVLAMIIINSIFIGVHTGHLTHD